MMLIMQHQMLNKMVGGWPDCLNNYDLNQLDDQDD